MTKGMVNTSFSMTTFNTDLWQMSFSDSVSTNCPPHPSCLTWKKKLAPSGIISPNASLTFIFRLFKSPLKQTTRRCSAIQTSTDLEPSVPDYLTQWWHVLLYACANWLRTEHSLHVNVWYRRWRLRTLIFDTVGLPYFATCPSPTHESIKTLAGIMQTTVQQKSVLPVLILRQYPSYKKQKPSAECWFWLLGI